VILLERRLERFKKVIAKRQLDIAIVLENVHDKHNIGAVLRSCDSIGVQHVYIVNTDPRLQNPEKYEQLSTSSGAAKWITLHYFEDVDSAVKELRESFGTIITTHLNSDSKSLYSIDFNSSFALVFGNEHEGVSDELLSHADYNVVIPQKGMVQSLNISVACAVCLFEIFRQRDEKAAYDQPFNQNVLAQQKLLEEWVEIHEASKRKI